MKNSKTISESPSSEFAPARGPLARGLVAAVKGYQWLGRGRVSACRFYPSCSNYAIEALSTHGAARGSWLALRRLSKCRPLGPHGIDLVPEAHNRRSHSQ
jgi:uncharacterized protein